MKTSKIYPYSCAHLWYYLRVEKLTGEQIQAKVREINAWLNETCIITCVDWFSPTADGKYPVIKEEQWHWSRDTSRVPSGHNVFGAPIATYRLASYAGDWNEVSLANNISFMRQDDLLAFKLKFGIVDGITTPDMLHTAS